MKKTIIGGAIAAVIGGTIVTYLEHTIIAPNSPPPDSISEVQRGSIAGEISDSETVKTTQAKGSHITRRESNGYEQVDVRNSPQKSSGGMKSGESLETTTIRDNGHKKTHSSKIIGLSDKDNLFKPKIVKIIGSR